MFSKLVSVALLTALAGRVLADDFKFNVTIGKANFLGAEVLAFPPSADLTSCDSKCIPAQTAITACDPTSTACFCANTTTKGLLDCEQCLFEKLIAINKPAPDPRAGSNVAVGGWGTNCATANITLATKLALTVPPTWDGPFDAVFPMPIGIAIAATGGILGSSLIYMLCNM